MNQVRRGEAEARQRAEQVHKGRTKVGATHVGGPGLHLRMREATSHVHQGPRREAGHCRRSTGQQGAKWTMEGRVESRETS